MQSLVGRWFVIDGDAGIVRYQGPVDGTSGEWLGVEWATRQGKHFGSKDNKQYFQCTFHGEEPRGSFIRNVGRINWGQSLLAAARSRYTDVVPRLPSAIDGHRGKIEAPRLETIIDFQKDFSKLTVLGLDEQQVYGTRDDLSEFRHVRTLLLARNFITRWESVEEILAKLPSLHTLDVSANPLYSPLNVSRGSPIRVLRLDNSPFVCWQDVCRISRSLHVRSLSHGWSRLSQLDDRLSATIEELRLECNLITDISSLEGLEGLRSLDISGNRSFARLKLSSNSFAKLEALDVSQTGLRCWSDIWEMNKLSRLQSLKATGIPLLHGLPADTARSHLIAYLPNIQKLDGSVISQAERVEMERYFLLLRARDVLATSKDLEELHKCPWTHSLLLKHGMPAVSQNPLTNRLETRLVQVTIQVAQDLEQEPTALAVRKLIRTMLVRQLRPIGMRLAKTRNFAMFIQPTHLDSWLPLDVDNRELSFYGIDDNSLIRILPK
ncbi:hypothetical protein EV183_003976 [Coemansia sp. RSA 2336]|nr:hypothetical protein EV183_003976 [Coemansia sp. RSA 2336]